MASSVAVSVPRSIRRVIILTAAILGRLTVLSAADDAATRLREVDVPVTQAWTDTGIMLQQGEPFRLEASGTAVVVGHWFRGPSFDRRVGPEGTYRWPAGYPTSRYTRERPFPLPTMRDGPCPAFGLIGKWGDDGAPFYLGARYEGAAPQTGRLWVGINDDDLNDNQGAWRVRIERMSRMPTPPAAPSIIEPTQHHGIPIARARVLLLYIDGLRPDVLREMAEAGFLPHFKHVFLDGGVACANAFTVFPSNTLIANGSLFTGLFSDRTGIKSQNQFERTTLRPRGQLSAWLPDGFIPKPTMRVINLLDKYAPENTHTFLARRRVPTLATRLGKAYRFTTLPIAPINPPPQWLHVAIDTLGPWDLAHRLPQRLDDANAEYTIEEILNDRDVRAIAVWLPMVDKTSHHSPHGQFGAARRDLALADALFGRILARLAQRGWDRSTYFILVSDHGHAGGDGQVNRACNLPRDWAHGQLGCNATVVGQSWTSPGLDPRRMIFFDNQGSGQTKLFLPYGSYFDGAWRRNRLYELTHYELRPNEPPLNLLDSLAAFRPAGWDGRGPAPMDLMLIKLDEARVLVWRDPDCQALIHREQDARGREVYRYEPLRRVAQDADGTVRSQPPLPGRDPLGYLQDERVRVHAPDPAWFERAHDATEWLRATAHSRYPDAIVTMAKFFAWQPPMSDLAPARDPDLLLTASPGWSFRADGGTGTDHGYPLADSMRISLFVSGPNIAHGVLQEPQRIVNVLPTMLEMIRWPYDPDELDGTAINGIYD